MLDLRVHPNQRQSLEFCVGQHHNILHIARGRLDVKYFLKILSIFFIKNRIPTSLCLHTLKMNETYCTSIDYWI